MAGNNKDNIFNTNDTLDINELASLNEDYSIEFIEELQNKVSQSASGFIENPIIFGQPADSELFEEIPESEAIEKDVIEAPINEENETSAQSEPNEEERAKNSNDIDENIDDNFVKKYKAKLRKQDSEESDVPLEIKASSKEVNAGSESASKDFNTKEIESLTGGNIVEKPITEEQIAYNESLDFLDGNVNYSKYVIYIDPENKEFIDSLTVKERKNLINRILREQDDIAITKKRLGLVQTVIKHVIISIITVTIAIPVIYIAVNASLEASINNYRRSQTIFKTLYKEKGKIKTQKSIY